MNRNLARWSAPLVVVMAAGLAGCPPELAGMVCNPGEATCPAGAYCDPGLGLCVVTDGASGLDRGMVDGHLDMLRLDLVSPADRSAGPDGEMADGPVDLGPADLVAGPDSQTDLAAVDRGQLDDLMASDRVTTDPGTTTDLPVSMDVAVDAVTVSDATTSDQTAADRGDAGEVAEDGGTVDVAVTDPGNVDITMTDGQIADNQVADNLVTDNLVADHSVGGDVVSDVHEPHSLKRIFVTADAIPMTVNEGNDPIEYFNEECQGRAATAGFEGAYIAWMAAVQNEDVTQRLDGASGWVRPDGKPFAVSVDALLAGEILYPPILDEANVEVPPSTFVATNVGADGLGIENGCSAADPNFTIPGGIAFGGTDLWTSGEVGPCGGMHRIYCIGVGPSESVSPPAGMVKGHMIFVSAETSSGNFDFATPTPVCPTKTTRLRATSAESIAEQLERLAGGQMAQPILRFDGVVVARSVTDFIEGAWKAPVNVTKPVNYLPGDLSVWTGAQTVTGHSAAGDSCGDWHTSGADTGVVGVAGAGNTRLIHEERIACGTQAHAYCFQLSKVEVQSPAGGAP